MSKVKISIFPNYAFQLLKDKYFLESSHELLLRPLLGNNFEITLVGILDLYSKSGNYKPIFNTEIKFIFLNIYRNKKKRLVLLKDYILVFLRASKNINKSSINYIFIPGNIGIIVAILSLLFKHPYALYYRGDWKSKTPRIFWRLKNLIFKNAKFIIYVGVVNDESIKMLNPQTEKVIPMLSIPVSNYGTQRKYFEKKPFTILYIGEISKEKGIYELLYSIKNLADSGFSNIYLTIVGNGQEYDQLKYLITRLNLNRNVAMLGKITETDRLVKLYYEHSIFCLPSYSEGFPRVIYEAMMFSMSIITTDVGKINTLLKDNYNALFVTKKDISCLEYKIKQLIQDEKLQIILGNNAFNTISPFIKEWENKNHGIQLVNWINNSLKN